MRAWRLPSQGSSDRPPLGFSEDDNSEAVRVDWRAFSDEEE